MHLFIQQFDNLINMPMDAAKEWQHFLKSFKQTTNHHHDMLEGEALQDAYKRKLQSRIIHEGNFDLFECYWLNQVPDHAGILIDRSLNAVITEQQEDVLLSLLNQYFSETNYQFIKLGEYHWMVAVAKLMAVKLSPIDSVIGKNLWHVLPEGPHRLQWQSLMTEIQMLLHQNKEKGLEAFNGIWFNHLRPIPKSALLISDELSQSDECLVSQEEGGQQKSLRVNTFWRTWLDNEEYTPLEHNKDYYLTEGYQYMIAKERSVLESWLLSLLNEIKQWIKEHKTMKKELLIYDEKNSWTLQPWKYRFHSFLK